MGDLHDGIARLWAERSAAGVAMERSGRSMVLRLGLTASIRVEEVCGRRVFAVSGDEGRVVLDADQARAVAEFILGRL